MQASITVSITVTVSTTWYEEIKQLHEPVFHMRQRHNKSFKMSILPKQSVSDVRNIPGEQVALAKGNKETEVSLMQQGSKADGLHYKMQDAEQSPGSRKMRVKHAEEEG